MPERKTGKGRPSNRWVEVEEVGRASKAASKVGIASTVMDEMVVDEMEEDEIVVDEIEVDEMEVDEMEVACMMVEKVGRASIQWL